MKKIFAVIILVIIFCGINNAQSEKRDSVVFIEGDSLTTSFKPGGFTISKIYLPDSLVGNTITFLESYDGITFYNVLKYDSSEVKIEFPLATTVNNRAVIPKLGDIWGIANEVKLRSGTYASHTVQTDTCWIYFDLMELK